MRRTLQSILILTALSGLTVLSTAAAEEAPTPESGVANASATPSTAEGAPVATDSTAAPEEEPAPKELLPPLVQEGRELIAQLSRDSTRVELLQDDAEKSLGEDLEVLNRQLAESKLDFLATISEMVDNLEAQQAKGLDGSEVREVLEFNLDMLGPAIVRHLDEAMAKLTELRAQRSTVAPADLPNLDQEISREVDWLESLFAAYANQVDQMKILGLDSKALARDLANRLAYRADRLLGRIQLADEQLGQLRERSANAPDDKALVAEIQLRENRKTMLAGALTHIASLMDRSDLDSSQYRQFLIRSTGQVTVDVFRTNVLRSLIDEWTQELRRQARESGPFLFAKLITFLAILAIFKLLATLARRLTQGAMARSTANISQLQRSMLLSVASRGVMIVGVLVGLSQLGVQLGPLLAGLGIAGFIVGFALQDSLANFASGVMILAYRPFDVADFIEAGGVRGNVSHMSLVSTTIMTFDNQTLIVPNSKIWGDVIRNITNQDKRRVDMSFHVSYEDDMERAEQTFAAICRDHPKVLSEPEPLIKVHRLGKSSIEFAVRPWVLTPDYWDVHWDVTREVRRRFLLEGFRAPLPQQDVHLRATEARSPSGAGT